MADRNSQVLTAVTPERHVSTTLQYMVAESHIMLMQGVIMSCN